ncbi:MAG: hypothetical protein QNJ69_07465 [Gammaproteobacteria bacterium]|nr:hypothetical protein [Gammaproteobacteria bacterium]
MARGFLLILLCTAFASAHAASDKILYHVHHLQLDGIPRVLSNLENLQKGMPDRQLDIRLLLQGDSILLLDPWIDDSFRQRLHELRQSGVRIEVSRSNYADNRNRVARDHPPQLVENLFSRIVELEQQGYQYVTP